MVTENFAAELGALAKLAREIENGTLSERAIGSAIAALIVEFPVYRTYGDAEGLPTSDVKLLDTLAARLFPTLDTSIADALALVLDLLHGEVSARDAAAATAFRIRFQQLTGPVMAKAVEDTLFYRHHAFIALNEVGCDLAASEISVESFHGSMIERSRLQPHGLLATATHDTKRGEDARARLYALSEAPEVWADAVTRWRQRHASFVVALADGPAPEPEIEWMLYQALAGVWPMDLEAGHTAALADLSERFLGFVEKALREAKLRSSWLDINEPYEAAVKAYARHLLDPANHDFLADFSTVLAPLRAGGRAQRPRADAHQADGAGDTRYLPGNRTPGPQPCRSRQSPRCRFCGAAGSPDRPIAKIRSARG